MSYYKNIIANTFNIIKKGVFRIFRFIFKPFINYRKDNKKRKENKKRELVDTKLNFELNKSKTVIEEIKDYIKNNFIADSDLDELKDLINYAKNVNLKSNIYLIKEAREKLEMKFLYVKGKIYYDELAKQKVNYNKKEKIKSEENVPLIGIIDDNNYDIIAKDAKENKLKKREKNKKIIDNLENKEQIAVTNNDLKILNKNIKKRKWEKNNCVSKEKEKSNVNIQINPQSTNYKNKSFVSYKVSPKKSSSFLYIATPIILMTFLHNNNEKVENVKEKKAFTNSSSIESKEKNDYFDMSKVEFKKMNLSSLNREFKKIYAISLSRIDKIRRNIIISFKILILSSKLFNISVNKNKLKEDFNNAISNKNIYNTMVNDAIYALESIKIYLENNLSLTNKNSFEYKELISYIENVKLSLVNTLQATIKNDEIKILKK